MPEKGDDRERALRALDDALAEAASYLVDVDPDMHGGHQTAREVLCHFVFWHREYTMIMQTLLDGRQPPLRDGTYAQLNAEAAREFAGRIMTDLASLLLDLQVTFRRQLASLPSWSIDFPLKQDSRQKSVAERVPAIENHLRDHMRRLRRAERLGEAWVKAYYPDEE